MDVIFTIVSRNYAAQAATLMESLTVSEPKARRVFGEIDIEGRACKNRGENEGEMSREHGATPLAFLTDVLASPRVSPRVSEAFLVVRFL